MRFSRAAAALLAVAGLAGCATVRPDGKTPPAPPDASLAPERLAARAFRAGCPQLLKRLDPSGLTEPSDWAEACADPRDEGFFARHFRPVVVGTGAGLVTGYYAPEVRALRAPAPGAVPVLGMPPALPSPAPDRAAIEAGALDGRAPLLAWVPDPADLFFLQVQGSGTLVFPDGSRLALGFAGANGHPYVAIGALLRARGVLEQTDMAAIRAWMARHPEAARALMRENPRYVFFRPLGEGSGPPRGALGLPLIAGIHVAADPRAMPPGAPVRLRTTVDGRAFERIVVIADTGAAIRGANRFDLYLGEGDEAGRIAGALSSPGRADLLLPRAAARRRAP